uniref:Neuropeptide receptor n=1 Tax=Diaphorina citri TaxID=121845 RepID=A0A2U9PFW0_DIACI|nr:neuropeptide receptor [Diaphorina citri]
MAYNSSTEEHEQPFVSLLRQRCEQVLNFSEPNHNAQYCSGTFDGWACWPNTPAGSRAFVPCPYFITGFDPSRFGHKDCTENGTWYRHPVSGKVWSNYSDCINLEDLEMRQKVNSIYETGYVVSLIALISSLVILSYFKSLRCPRITVHKNLFTSFSINNFLWLLWYQFVIPNPSVSFENGISCQILHVVLHYFLLSNYFWMLAEGLYLHTLLVCAFFSEDKLVRCLYLVGWGFPLLIISVYTGLRIKHGDTEECWINDSKFSTVLLLPVCFSMALNLFFLCNIVRVLLIKLRNAPGNANSRPSRQVIQGFRATLLLFPLLGVHYFLTPFRPEPGHSLEPAYEYTLAASASFQGLCVAILFCFCNGEVVAQMKRRWAYVTFRPRTNSYTATTVSFIRSTAGPLTCEDNV